MTAASVRMLIALSTALAVVGGSAAGSFAAGDVASCTLTPSEVTSPENVGSILEAAVAAGSDDVWAMGSHVSGPAATPLARHWDGTAWTTTKLDLPPGPVSISSIYDARAFSPDDIWAVGSWMGEDPFVQHWDGKVWRAVEVPTIVGTERILTGVDGTGPNDIWIVGQREDQGEQRGVVLHFDGSQWSIVPAPAGAASLHDVAMIDTKPVVAGWSIGPKGFAQGILATMTSDLPTTPSWQFADLGNDARENLFLFGVAASSPADAVAVGFSNDSPNADTPHAYRLADGSWQETTVPDLGGSARLVAVATDPSATVAVGQVLVGGINRALALRATDGGWEEIPGSGKNAPDTLAGVAIQDGDVWAVGRGVVTGATYGVASARIYACA
jgi:hypothetical protein